MAEYLSSQLFDTTHGSVRSMFDAFGLATRRRQWRLQCHSPNLHLRKLVKHARASQLPQILRRSPGSDSVCGHIACHKHIIGFYDDRGRRRPRRVASYCYSMNSQDAVEKYPKNNPRPRPR